MHMLFNYCLCKYIPIGVSCSFAATCSLNIEMCQSHIKKVQTINYSDRKQSHRGQLCITAL